jgi:hypothetical protein
MTVEVKLSWTEEFWLCKVPYSRRNNPTRAQEIRTWCRENFEHWNWEDLHAWTNIVLYREEDVALFVLRWS